MKIAQVAPLAESVPPKLYGGTERVVSYLTEELVRQGHNVTLFASGDSRTAAELHACVESALRFNEHIKDPHVFNLLQFDEVRERADEFDVIHFHTDYLHFPLVRELELTNTVTTLHGRLDLPGYPEIFARHRGLPMVSISNHQRRPLPDVHWAGTVLHGLPRNVCRFEPAPREGYLAFLGRISPEKGLDRAIKIARLAGLPLKVGAREPLRDLSNPCVRADWEYYENVVKPLLADGHVEMVGEVGDAEKPGLLGNALALLFPIDWPEPFGLVMPEALACGTPVVARRRGSVPEVITHGVTGLVGESDEELADLCASVHRLDRQACRDEATRRFSPAAMANGYEAAYQRARADATRGWLRHTPRLPITARQTAGEGSISGS